MGILDKARSRYRVVQITSTGEWLRLRQPEASTLAAADQLVSAVHAAELAAASASDQRDTAESSDVMAADAAADAARSVMHSTHVRRAERDRIVGYVVESVCGLAPASESVPDADDDVVWSPITLTRGGRSRPEIDQYPIDVLEPRDVLGVYAAVRSWVLTPAPEVAARIAAFRRAALSVRHAGPTGAEVRNGSVDGGAVESGASGDGATVR